ncbi:MAG: OmpA family protein [Clostridiales bacterium]|nr:OmpA family protein [Clostridiales bacterium]
MRRIYIIITLITSLLQASAVTTVKGSKFSDNWSIGYTAGVTSPFNGGPFWHRARGIMGIDLRKQVTPVLGLGIDGTWSFNTSRWMRHISPNTFDGQYLGVYGAVNFMNAFAGYKGTPRTFELEGVAGVGWLHSYYPKSIDSDGNTWGTKAGLNFNINLGKQKQWTLSFKPRMLWNMGGHTKMTNIGASAIYDSNHAAVELSAGITYHFGNSYGGHSFVIIKPYDQSEIDALNAEINILRARLAESESGSDDCREALQEKERELQECLSRPTDAQTVVHDGNNTRYIFFNISSSDIQADQRPNIFMLAQTAKENRGSKIIIEGFASSDGNAAFNRRLAQSRAEAVKRALIAQGIPASSIEARGEGIGHLFDTNNWNRVARCTVVIP